MAFEGLIRMAVREFDVLIESQDNALRGRQYQQEIDLPIARLVTLQQFRAEPLGN